MWRIVLILSLVVTFPFGASAATILSGDTLVTSTPITGNLYEAGGDIRVGSNAPGDVLLAGGTLTLAAPVKGDVLLLGGSVDVQQPIAGDARLIGGKILIDKGVAGDLMILGGSITTLESIPTTYALGSSIDIRGGAHDAITLYGGTVSLAGEFAGDVNVTVSDKLTIAPGTVIHGSLKYNAPQEVGIPADAKISGKVEYTGTSSFVPSPEEAKNFAIAGAGIFFIVKLLASILVIALVAGLFPSFASLVADETLGKGIRHFSLLFLLGFAILVATPILILLLLLSFAGFGVALLLGSLYLLFLLLSGIYAGILAGGALARTLSKRVTVSWRYAVLGTILLTIVSIIPFVGGLVAFILAAAALGALVRTAFLFAFATKQDIEL